MSDRSGVGVMINQLFENGRDTIKALEQSQGKTIARVYMDPEYNFRDGGLVLEFNDATALTLYDAGRSCCEHRYLTCDDTLQEFIGTRFQGVEVKEMPEIQNEYGEPHEQQALLVCTNLGTITVVTHNEHNGYYGGFYMKADYLEA